MRIDCLQCHDDNLGSIELGDPEDRRVGLQEDFHQLAAFFSEVGTGFRGVNEVEAGRSYEYQYLGHDEAGVVSPGVPFREDLLPKEGTRREQLAGWLTHPENRQFARATVNRVWALMFGLPLSDPIDDIPLHGDLPPGLDTLADDFIEHDYNLHRLIRLIALTEPFQRDSRADFEITEDHERAWAVFPCVRLRPEQVAGGIIQATSLSTIDSSAGIITRLVRFGQESEFVNRYGDRGEDEFTLQSATIPQQLIMMNGSLVGERTQASDVLMGSVAQIAQFAASDEQAIETAFLTVLTRHPTPQQLEHFGRRLKGKSGEARAKEIEDLFWVLFNSSYFKWNH